MSNLIRTDKKMRKAKHTNNEYSIDEAYRYLANAKDTIAKSPIQYGIYTDSKYVREAAGMAYLAALKALDVYLISKGIDRTKLPKSIDGYRDLIRRKIPLNGKLNASLKIVYENLHVFAYYRGGTAIQMVKEGFENVKKIIEMMDRLIPGHPENIVSEPPVKYKKKQVKTDLKTI